MSTSIATSRPAARRPRLGRAGKRFIPWILVAGVVGLIVWSLKPKPLDVDMAIIKPGPLTVSVLEEGKTRIRHRYVISPTISGYLDRIPLRAGAPIIAGKTVLAVIQPQPANFLDTRTQGEAQARLKAAEAAKLQRQAQLERARSALDMAQKDATRASALRKSGAVSVKDWETAENLVAVLTREFHAAEFSVQVGEFERAQAEAFLTQSQGKPGDTVKPMEILAPVDGYVLNVYEESARAVTAGMPLMEVGSPADLEAEIEMLSSDAVAVKPGAEVSIEQWGGDMPLRGKVSVVEPGGFTKISALGVEEQRVKVRVDFVDPLPAGVVMGDRFRVEARIVTWHSERVLQIPTGALFRRGNDWMTFFVDGNKAVVKTVTIGRNSGVAAEVRSGVAEGDKVILHPPDTIKEGAAVVARDGK